ncbi:DUF7946 domain-containing protein [Citrobacter freundii]|uniref:DUF7946 domain-containing protein n=2 Tax=Citrobacter freundii TaxID=546 RepID=UPI00396ACF22
MDNIRDNIITLRFDGKDAQNHEVELGVLGESFQGFAKVLSTAGNFAVSQKYYKKCNYQEVKVYARDPRANCFSIDAVTSFISQQQLFSGLAAAILPLLIQYIFSRNAQKKEEMKLLKDSLDKAIEALGNKDKDTIQGLLNVIDKMATELRPAVRQAVSPIGNTCSTITIKSGESSTPLVITESDKEVIDRLEDDEVIPLREYQVLITEFDGVKKTAKIIFVGDDNAKRISAEISDPAVMKKENPYILALQAFMHAPNDPSAGVTVTAKAIAKKGAISKLFIMDIN